VLEAESITVVYGCPPPELAAAPAGALQISPLSPGAEKLEDVEPQTLAGVVMMAAPGALERRYQLALALQALRPSARLTVMAPKDKGGARLRKELEAFGCAVEETARRHHRICMGVRPAIVIGLDESIKEGAPRFVDSLSLWSQPGVFSWDRIDPGSALLMQVLPELTGLGADLGCGIGYLARAVLGSPQVQRLDLIDIDRRAVEAARRNIDDRRAELHWADVTAMEVGRRGQGVADHLCGLDFVVMNPPFHQEGVERRELGQVFIRQAAEMLRKGGGLWLVANRHLPYEAELGRLFARVELKAERDGFKVFEARR
jgi:16S rRNA (guanine1207-N2)-methyltransferase